MEAAVAGGGRDDGARVLAPRGVFSTELGSVDDIALSPSGDLVAVAVSLFEGNQWGGALQVLRLSQSGAAGAGEAERGEQPELVAELRLEAGVSSVCWVGADTLAFGADDGVVRVTKLGLGQEASDRADLPVAADTDPAPVEDGSSAAPPPPPPALPGYLVKHGFTCGMHDDLITSVACWPLQRHLVVSGSWDHCVRRWDVTRDPAGGDGASVGFRGHAAGVDAVACSAVSPHVAASASLDGTVRLWDFRASSKGSASAVALGAQALSVAFHPAQEFRVVAGTVAGHVALLDTRKLAAPLRQARLHRAAVFGVAFAPGAEAAAAAAAGAPEGAGAEAGGCTAWAVASCSADKTALVTRVALDGSGVGGEDARVAQLAGAHDDYVRKVLPLAGGGLATCSWDRTVRLWG